MFGVGLQFHIEELLGRPEGGHSGRNRPKRRSRPLLGALLAVWLGWSWGAGLVFGIALSVASTVVLVRVLSDNRHLHTPTGHIAVGWLVVEDIFTVLVLVLMPALFGPDAAGGGASVALALALALAKVGGLVVFTVVVGRRVIPWLLSRVAATRSRELFTLCVLVLALGIAVGSAVVFGVSMALGAFLAGIVVGRSDFSVRAASDALPMRDAFAVLFFVSVGMLFDPAQLVRAAAARRGDPGDRARRQAAGRAGHHARSSAIPCAWVCRWPWRWPRSGSSRSSWRTSAASSAFWARRRSTSSWRPPFCRLRSTRSCTGWSIR